MLRRLAVLSLAAVAFAPPQEAPKTFTATVERCVVKSTDADATIELEISTNLPDGALIAVSARMGQFDYTYIHNYFSYVAPEFSTAPGNRVSGKVSGGRVKSVKLPLPANGVYRLEVFFDPQEQTDRTLRKRMGAEKFTLMVFHEKTLSVGASDRAFKEILADSQTCRKALEKAQEILDKLVKIGDADEDEDTMNKRALPQVQQLGESQAEFSARVGKTLLNATYKYSADVLSSVVLIGQYLKEIVKKKKYDESKGVKPNLGPDNVPSGGTPEAPFNPNPGGTPGAVDPATGEETPTDAGGHPEFKETGILPVPSPIQGRLNFDNVARQLRRAQEVRRRELLLWLFKFTRVTHETIVVAADSARRGGPKEAAADVFAEQEKALKVLDKTMETVLQTEGEKEIKPWIELAGGDKFVKVPDDIRKYLAAVRKEIESGMAAEEPKDQLDMRKNTVETLDAFDRHVMGKKPPPPAPKNP